MTAEGMRQHNNLPIVCYFDYLNFSLAKHLKHISLPGTEGLGKASGKIPIDLKDDC